MLLVSRRLEGNSEHWQVVICREGMKKILKSSIFFCCKFNIGQLTSHKKKHQDTVLLHVTADANIAFSRMTFTSQVKIVSLVLLWKLRKTEKIIDMFCWYFKLVILSLWAIHTDWWYRTLSLWLNDLSSMLISDSPGFCFIHCHQYNKNVWGKLSIWFIPICALVILLPRGMVMHYRYLYLYYLFDDLTLSYICILYSEKKLYLC